MQSYKITYKAGKNEHVIELEATDKEEAYTEAQHSLGNGVDIISVIHIPESYGLF